MLFTQTWPRRYKNSSTDQYTENQWHNFLPLKSVKTIIIYTYQIMFALFLFCISNYALECLVVRYLYLIPMTLRIANSNVVPQLVGYMKRERHVVPSAKHGSRILITDTLNYIPCCLRFPNPFSMAVPCYYCVVINIFFQVGTLQRAVQYHLLGCKRELHSLPPSCNRTFPVF